MKKILILSDNAVLHEKWARGLFSVQKGELEHWDDYKDLWSSAENILLVEFEKWQVLSERQQEKVKSQMVLILSYGRLKRKEQEYCKQLAANDLRVIGVIDSEMPMEFFYPLFRGPASLEALPEKGLEKLVSHSMLQMRRIKHLHEQLVPLRSEKIKGIRLVSKYAAGERSGGEFFDIVKRDGEMIVFMAASSSYLISSLGINFFERLRRDEKLSLEKFVEQLGQEVGSIDPEGKEETHHFLAQLDMRRILVTGYNFGNTTLISNTSEPLLGNDYPLNHLFLEKAAFSRRLERGERLAVVSAGVRKNCNDTLREKPLALFLQEELGKGGKAFLNEVFYQLKKGDDSYFLKYDASVIYIEVDSNAIIQV